MVVTEQEIAHLNRLYESRRAFHGELHDHSASGGTSDGRRSLAHWRGAMEALGIDFAAILDHKQVRHMYLPEWEDGMFIAGTEPGAKISDSLAELPAIHYNMIFDSPKKLEDLLEAFPEFQFTGGTEGHFQYPAFTRARMCELIEAVRERGGLWVHPHPKQKMKSDDPLEYFFADDTGIEVFYYDLRHDYTKANYELWTTLLSLGKRVWACAGCDLHTCAHDTALTTLYAEEKKNAAYLSHLREGDFVCGAVGMRMCVGETKMGGKCAFGERLELSVGDFHRSVKNPYHTYRVHILDDTGVVESHLIGCDETTYFAIDTDPARRFYRAEVIDETENFRIAIGNPIWNQ
ncbi:MAG: hypothetical protein IJW16_05580 [Clostridia bacterium]|nr:hypothetical protein [Clostridia bacterium]